MDFKSKGGIQKTNKRQSGYLLVGAKDNFESGRRDEWFWWKYLKM